MTYRILILLFFLSQTIFAGTSIVSINKDNTESGNASSFYPRISANGKYVAFTSDASDLVYGDTNGKDDVFVRDIENNITYLISVSSSGELADDNSEYYPSISADGRYIAFESYAGNLVDGDNDGYEDIFVHDLQNRTTHLISVSTSGEKANDDSEYPSISADGRYIAFESYADNLVDNDINDKSDIFVRDTQTNRTFLVSLDNNGNQSSDGGSYFPSISANGRYVAFESSANLTSIDNNGILNIFVRDLENNTTRLVSIGENNQPANDNSYYPSISADGRYIAFMSWADNLVPNDQNNKSDVFVHDIQTGETILVSVNPQNGEQANGDSDYPSISDNGRYISFYSQADNLVDNDNNNNPDVFIYDLKTKSIKLVSVDSNGIQGNGESEWSSISENGQYIAFDSLADNLYSNDNNTRWDVFIRKNSLLVGTLWGLPYRDSIVIQNNNTDILELTANGPFELISGSADYSLTILEQPQRANCMIYNPAGTIGQIRPIVRCFSRRYR